MHALRSATILSSVLCLSASEIAAAPASSFICRGAPTASADPTNKYNPYPNQNRTPTQERALHAALHAAYTLQVQQRDRAVRDERIRERCSTPWKHEIVCAPHMPH